MPLGGDIERQVRSALRMLDRARGLSGKSRGAMLEVDLVIIWGLHRGWTPKVVSKLTGLSDTTIKKKQRWLQEHPWSIFAFPLMDRRDKAVLCGFCGMPIPLGRQTQKNARGEVKARIHIAQHVLPREIIAMYGVVGPQEFEPGWN